MSSPWVMMLRHDEEGNVIEGSKSALKDAVRRGADVRITLSTLQGEVFWNRQPSVVHVYFSVVGCVIAGVSDTKEDFSNGRRIAIPPVYEWHFYDTNGKHHKLEFDRQTSNKVEENKDGKAISWFVRDDWTLLFQHEASGKEKFGSVSKLREAIAKGSDVKVKCWDSKSQDLQTIIACQSLSVWDDIVSSSSIELPETVLDLGSGQRVFTGNLHWRSHHTTGLREVVEIDRKTGTLASKDDHKAEMYWYGRDPRPAEDAPIPGPASEWRIREIVREEIERPKRPKD